MGFGLNGAGEETRTLDVHLGKVVLYQLSYARNGRERTQLRLPCVNSIFLAYPNRSDPILSNCP